MTRWDTSGGTGGSRERRPSPRVCTLRRAARWTSLRRKLLAGLQREAYGSCATSTVASGTLCRSLERRKPKRALAPARSKPLCDGTELPRGAERPEGGRRRPPSLPAATVCVGPAARRMPRRSVGRWEGRCRERQEGIGRREASRLLGRSSSEGSNPKSASGMKQARRAGRGASRQEGESPWRRNVPGVETPG